MGFQGTSGNVQVAGEMTIISKTVPAGKYVLVARVSASNEDFLESDAIGSCDIPGDSVGVRMAEDGDGGEELALTSAITHGGGAIELKCNEASGNFDVDSASLTGVKVDSLG